MDLDMHSARGGRRRQEVRMRADHCEALLDFLLGAVSDQGTTPFPEHVLAGMRRVVRCEMVSSFEWSPQELLEFSLAADEPEETLRVWPVAGAHDEPVPDLGRRPASKAPQSRWGGQSRNII
jgi:hypothetical protein